jgi:inorganic triphosphatase YgiF
MKTHLEVERTFELAPSVELPDLASADGIAAVRALEDEDLDATYYDTPDLSLARARTTLRRRTGGRDAGWHLKLPVGGDTREEVHKPSRGGGTTVPRDLAGLVRARVRGQRLAPVVRLRTTRRVLQLLDDAGTVLAEVADDAVTGDVLGDPRETVVWREVEVELVEGDDAVLDAVGSLLQTVGAVPSPRPRSWPARSAGGCRCTRRARCRAARPPARRCCTTCRSTPTSSWPATPPSVATCPTRCTRCAWPRAGCAAR